MTPQVTQQQERLSSSLVILFVQIFVVGIWLSATGRFAPVIVNDTIGYSNFPFHSMEAALDHIRTPGYPIFLQLNRLFAEGFNSVPLAHYVVYLVATLIFFIGVWKVTASRVIACASASTLLYSRVLHGYVDTIAADTVAAAAGIAVCGLALWRITETKRWLTGCLVVATAIGWFIRPSYLFLISLVPMLTWLIHSAVPTTGNRSTWRNVLLALCITAGPVLAYSSLRYCVVGRFGIVSFGGYNQVGIAGQFLRQDDLNQLSPDLRPTAETVLQYRASGELPPGQYDNLPQMNYMRLEDRYDITIWHEFSPAAEDHVGHDARAVNTLLRRLGTELIYLHPREYVVWLAKAVRQAAKKVLWDAADNPVNLALLFMALVRVCRPGFLVKRRCNCESVIQISPQVLLLLALTYLVFSLAVVIPICPPLGRFTDAAAVMLTSPLAAWLCGNWWPDMDPASP